jgi:flagella basal body P-ring formation protein FlgA
MNARMAVLLGALALAASLGEAARAQEALETRERLQAAAIAAATRATGRPAAELEVAQVDPRLRLAPCSEAPVAHLAPGMRSPAQLTVEVSCSQPAWRQYLAVRVHAEEAVVIAARPLSRLQVIEPEDLALVTRDLASLPAGYFRSAEEVLGRIVQRSIGAGEVLDPGTARPPPLVRRGQAVTLLVQSGGLSVRASGIALADAGRSERVRVRNSTTSRQLEGIVLSADTVQVPLE